MKKLRSVSLVAVVTLAAACNLCLPVALHAGPRLTEAQAAALQPTPPSLIPRTGNFWSLSCPTNPPLPFDFYPNLPVYRLPDGSFLVDDSTVPLPPRRQVISIPDARSQITQGRQANQQRLLSTLLNEASVPGIPDPTNAPPQGSPSPPQLLPPGSAPTNGTFRFLAKTNWPPMPINPCTGCDVYALSDGTYLVDDSSYSWPTSSGNGGGAQGPYQPLDLTGDLRLEIKSVSNSLANVVLHGTTSNTLYTILSRQSLSPEDPWNVEQVITGAAGQDWTPTQIPTFGYPVRFFWAHVGADTPGRLWIQIVSKSTNWFNLILHGTTDNTSYDIRSTTSLSSANNWATETNFPGANGQFWTPVSIPLASRPSLFLSARSWVDSIGSGIPDWWLLQYFGTVGADPYSDPAGDGWTLLQDYINGWNPTNYCTPPALQGVYLSSNASGGVVISWNLAAVTPISFTIQRNSGGGWQTIATVPGNFTSFTDVNPTPGASYQVRADYPNGSCSYAAASNLSNLQPSLTLPATIASGPGGRLFLLTGTPSITVTGLLVTAQPYPTDHPKDGIETVAPQYPYTNFYGLSQDVSGVVGAASLQAAPLRLGTGFVPRYGSYKFWLQALGTNGTLGNPLQPDGQVDATPFLDGRQHLVDNLNFALRASPASRPFDFYFPALLGLGAGECYGVFPAYTTAGFSWAFAHSDNVLLRQAFLDPFLPFENASVLRAFCFATNRFDPYGNPLDVGYTGLATMNTWDYYFSSFAYAQSGTTNVPPRQLDANTAQYIFYGPASDHNDVPDLGMTWDQSIPGWRVSYDVRNVYGLRMLSVLCVKVTQSPQPLAAFMAAPGGILPALGTTNQPGSGWLYMRAEDPVFQPAGFHFISLANSSPALCGPGWDIWTGVPNTNSFITSVGTQSSFYLWSRLAVSNAYPGTVSYLQDYFEKACKIDVNGLVTTNQTGLLSEYGSFFPTEPGPVALITKPDLATGQTNSGVVHVISLNVDANHDGTVDPTFYGSDFTTPDKPYVFWVNNDYDRLTWDSDDGTNYEDSVSSVSRDARSPGAPWVATPDCEFRSFNYTRLIPCQRDLQDFARLWVCGVTSNLLATLPPGATVTLSWGDVGNPNPANPTIDIFPAADPDGGLGYLTNATISASQVLPSACPYLQRLAPGQSIQLNASRFTNHWAGNYFIWCGVSNGSGGLTLTIADTNSNTVARSTVYVQIVNLKQLYERWTVGETAGMSVRTNAVPAENDVAPLTLGFQYTYSPLTDANTPYILYVHGWNMQTWEKDRYAESAFKRLYWQGYRGRFGVFRWPTDTGFNATLIDAMLQPHNYDGSELTAWKSAAGLLNKLTDLNAKYPGRVYLLAHSMGNVVAGEALRLASEQSLGQLINTYVANQAAIPAHVYDSTVTSPYLINYTHSAHSIPAPGHPQTPNIYGDRLTNNAATAGRRVNYFNGNDYALSPDAWCFDQELKPDRFIGSGYYWYTGSTNDPAPWNHFQYLFTSGDPPQATLDIVNSIEDRYSVLAYAANPYSTALGATPGIITFDNRLDLTTVWLTPDPLNNSYKSHFWHSAQFRGDCWQEWNYWNTLLLSPQFGYDIRNP